MRAQIAGRLRWCRGSGVNPATTRQAVEWAAMVARWSLSILLAVLVSAASYGGQSAEVLPQAREGLDPVVFELLETLEVAVRASPDDAAARGRLCMAYEANLLWPEASRCYAKASMLDPENAVWRLHQAVALIEVGDVSLARERLEEALQLAPDLQPARQRLAHLLLEVGDLEASMRLFEKLAASLPESAAGYLGAGEVDLLAGRIDSATSWLERAVALDPLSAPAHYQLGLAYRARQRVDEAERELALGRGSERRYLASPLEAEIASLSVHMTAQIERAGALLEAGRNAEAAALLEGLVHRSSGNSTLLNDLAIAYLRQGRLAEARALLDRAVELEPGRFGTRLNLSSWASSAGEVVAAVSFARQAVEMAPGVAATHLALAQALGDHRFVATLADKASARTEMLAELRRALQLGVDTPDAYLQLARELWRDERPQEALEALEPALAQWPDFWPGYLMQAWILVRSGRFDEGELSLETVRAMAPGHPDVANLEALITAGRAAAGGESN